MADAKKLREAAANKAVAVAQNSYKPTRETDKYILDRLSENVPGWRPSSDPKESYKLSKLGDRLDGTPMTDAEREAFYNYTDNSVDFTDTISSPKKRLEGFEAFERDLDIIHGDDNQTYHTNREEWDGAAKRLRKTNLPIMELNASDKKAMQDLRNEVAKNMTAPGVQEGRSGRIQEVIEAMDLTNPESGGRAFLREFWRRAVDDKGPRVKVGFKDQTGEEFMLTKLKESGMEDEPYNRNKVLQKLGLKVMPATMPLLDSSGNKVPKYLEELQAEKKASLEKDYMGRRRDSMADTPERD